MQNPPQVENEIRLQAIVRLLESCPVLGKGLNEFDGINGEINEKILPGLIDDTSELVALIKDKTLKGPSYQQLINESDNLEFFIKFPSKLDQYSENPEDFIRCVNSLELIDQLHKKFAHQAPIIDKLYEEAEKRRNKLVENCCVKLEKLDDLSIETLSSLVDNLKICGKFNEMELRLKYLEARDNWFNNACEQQGASFHNVVQVHCKGLPMIFREYDLLFCQDNAGSDDDTEACRRRLATFSIDSLDQDEFTIINTWLLLKASIFVSSLELYLQAIHHNDIKTPTMIEDTIEKCSQLAESLSDFGFDFSSQLRPLFINAITKEIKSCLDHATENFETSFTKTIFKSIESLLLPVDDEILRKTNLRPSEQLPKSIEHYPIFRVYCLRLLDSLRWVSTAKKLISPLNLCHDTYSALNASLSRVVKAISLAMNLDNNSNNIYLTKIAISMITEVVPFISDYCEQFFPEKIILNALGLTKTEFRNLGKFTNFRLDMKFVSEPLRLTMPTLLETISNC